LAREMRRAVSGVLRSPQNGVGKSVHQEVRAIWLPGRDGGLGGDVPGCPTGTQGWQIPRELLLLLPANH